MDIDGKIKVELKQHPALGMGLRVAFMSITGRIVEAFHPLKNKSTGALAVALRDIAKRLEGMEK